jgi:predicted nucleic acid-binding protein
LLVLDSGGLSRLAERSPRSLALIRSLRSADLWPPVVPTVVLAESLQGHAGRDAKANRFLKTCLVETHISQHLARRAAELRRRAGRGSAVDAVVVALAEPAGVVLTGDEADLRALTAHAKDVVIERI